MKGSTVTLEHNMVEDKKQTQKTKTMQMITVTLMKSRKKFDDSYKKGKT